ncbi:unnamed protein product [Acidithrix sp. C25]|nr:unnamed protein product [Acidithrix sp. C25]
MQHRRIDATLVAGFGVLIVRYSTYQRVTWKLKFWVDRIS